MLKTFLSFTIIIAVLVLTYSCADGISTTYNATNATPLKIGCADYPNLDGYSDEKMDYTQDNVKEARKNSDTYDVFFISSSDMSSSDDFNWAETFIFDIVQVKNTEDVLLEQKINETIAKAICLLLARFLFLIENREPTLFRSLSL